MAFKLVDLTGGQVSQIETGLEEYDAAHIGFSLEGAVNIGLIDEDTGKLAAGACGCMTVYKIFYVSTVFVDEAHRGRGLGRKLMEAVEERAKALGANIIRLDTFDWQGAAFYKHLGYEQAGFYESKADGFAEYFFIRRL